MKNRRLLFIISMIIALALAACSPDGGDEQENPEPEPTAIVNVPEQPEESASDNDEPVKAPEVSESKGVFDTEVMVENLDDYVLRVDDLPNQYKIMVDGEQHLTNLKVINSVGEVEGKRYLAATTRVDGWSLELERVNKEELIPYTIFSKIVVFETADGAETAFGPDWFEAYNDEDRETSWIEDGCEIADACVLYYYETLEPTTELTTLQYEVAFVYKNVLAVVMGRGLDFDMKPEYIIEAAEIMFDKIDAGPMAE